MRRKATLAAKTAGMVLVSEEYLKALEELLAAADAARTSSASTRDYKDVLINSPCDKYNGKRALVRRAEFQRLCKAILIAQAQKNGETTELTLAYLRAEMSYDISLRDPVSGDVLHAESPHQLAGGTYIVGGTTEMWLNVTYNYYEHFQRIGNKGIRTIYGMSGAESLPVLQKAADELDVDLDDDYWKPTEGNARHALVQLMVLARSRPDGIWQGD